MVTEKAYKTIAERRGFQIALHIMGWIFFISLPFLFGIPDTHYGRNVFYKSTMYLPVLITFFYLNYYYFIPRYLTKEKTGVYILLVLFSLIIIVLLHYVVDHYIFQELFPHQRSSYPGPPRNRFSRFGPQGLFGGLLMFAISTSIKITSEWLKNEKRRKELENEHLSSELSFLKSQVNPHFLFNTLNNIYSLSLSNSSQTSEAIMKLSQLLRYMLYETDGRSVSLEKEIDYIRDYIALQKIRIADQVKISFTTEGSFSDKRIVPMLLVPFIENAFKHGIDYSEDSFIDITIRISPDSLGNEELFLSVRNTIHRGADKIRDAVSGIGLVNVTKRLELLYSGKHSLEIHKSEDLFIVKLSLKL